MPGMAGLCPMAGIYIAFCLHLHLLYLHYLTLTVSPRQSIAMSPETHGTPQVAEKPPDASNQPENPEDDMTKTAKVIVIISVLLSMFLVALDRTILATV